MKHRVQVYLVLFQIQLLGADITGNIEYLTINKEPEKWAEKALTYSNGYERGNVQKAFVKRDMILILNQKIDGISNKIDC